MATGAGGRNADAGIRLVLEEIRDLRREMAEDRRRADEERREERRRADEDRARADEDRKRADLRFEHVVADSRKREHQLRDALVVIGSVGRRILAKLDEHSRLLKSIDRKIDRRGNGRPNGH